MKNPHTDQYLATALWSSTDEDGTPLDRVDDGWVKWDPATESALRAECETWLTAHAELIDAGGGDYGRAAHDLWLAQNGHGAGFWVGSDWPEDIGRALTDASKALGERNLYLSDPDADGQRYVCCYEVAR